MAKNKKTPKVTAKVAAPDGVPRDQRSPPSSPTHRVPDLFELSEYDFEELCEDLVRGFCQVSRQTARSAQNSVELRCQQPQ
jgi:hypothetical protein